MSVLRANVRALNSRRIGEITQFVFRSLYTHMYFVLSRTEETLHKTSSTVLPDTRAFCQHSTFCSLINKEGEGVKEKELRGALSFSFLLRTSPFSLWVVGWHGSDARRNMIGLLGRLRFFKRQYFLSASGANTVSNGKHGLLGLSAPPLTQL